MRRASSRKDSLRTASTPLMELFVLVPAPFKPVVLRVDRHSTGRQVKSALERKRGWPCSQQRLMLENGREVSDRQTLISLRLHKEEFPTLHLQLVAPPTTSARTVRAVMDALSAVTDTLGADAAQAADVPADPDVDVDEQAAIEIQRVLRGRQARRQREDERLWLAIRELCAHTERRKAVSIQARWRQAIAAKRAARELRKVQAASSIQRVHRSRQRRLHPKRHQAAWLRGEMAAAEQQQVAEQQSDKQDAHWDLTPGSSPETSVRLAGEALPPGSPTHRRPWRPSGYRP